MIDVINEMGGAIDHVVIDMLESNVYFARMYIEMYSAGNRKEVCVDARPSDCIALALRAQAPLYVSEEVLKSGAVQSR